MLFPFKRAVTSRTPGEHALLAGVLSFVGSTFTQEPVSWNPAKLTSQRAASVMHPVSALDTSYSWGCRTVCSYSSRSRGRTPAFGCLLSPPAKPQAVAGVPRRI